MADVGGAGSPNGRSCLPTATLLPLEQRDGAGLPRSIAAQWQRPGKPANFHQTPTGTVREAFAKRQLDLMLVRQGDKR